MTTERFPLRVRRAILLATALFCLGDIRALAEDAPGRWLDSAIEAYQKGMESSRRNQRLQLFAESERLFAAAIQGGADTADTWANLGSAALQAEKLGPAIVAYRRALVLDPGHERASQNLTHAREQLPDWIPTPARGGVLDTFFFWHRALSRAERQDSALACFVLATIFASLSIAFRINSARYVALLLASGWLALTLSVLFDQQDRTRSEGVVIASEATARSADSINAPLRFGESLPSGTEVRILESREHWLHIELHNGRDAWVNQSSVERIALKSG